MSVEGTAKLIPEEGSMYYHRVQHYRELLDSLQMDAYTHGSILHPEITVDSHIPAYATTRIRGETRTHARTHYLPWYIGGIIMTWLYLCVTAQIGNTESELKKLAEENPELKEAYMAKTRRLKVQCHDSNPHASFTTHFQPGSVYHLCMMS